MSTKQSRSRGGRRFVVNVHKPHGVIQPRVQKVGPEHFGILSVDCAKARFKWMLCDFYGNVLIPPTTVERNHPEPRTRLKLARGELLSVPDPTWLGTPENVCAQALHRSLEPGRPF